MKKESHLDLKETKELLKIFFNERIIQNKRKYCRFDSND